MTHPSSSFPTLLYFLCTHCKKIQSNPCEHSKPQRLPSGLAVRTFSHFLFPLPLTHQPLHSLGKAPEFTCGCCGCHVGTVRFKGSQLRETKARRVSVGLGTNGRNRWWIVGWYGRICNVYNRSPAFLAKLDRKVSSGLRKLEKILHSIKNK